MAHTSRKDNSQASNVPENYYDQLLLNQNRSNEVVSNILDRIINDGAQILHKKYLSSQINPYASRILARELIMNASWAFQPIGPNDITAEPDDDLEIPPIDEWAGGVLPIRSADATGLRASVPPPRESKSPAQQQQRAQQQPKDVTPSENQPRNDAKSIQGLASLKGRSGGAQKTGQKKKVKPPISEAAAIARAFEEAKKKTAVSMKSVTVDSDFTVIQITEPKGLPPALIVPKVTTKKSAYAAEQQSGRARPVRPVIKKPQPQQKRRAVPKLVEPDTPIFDDEIAEVSYSDKFVCAPGVTFRDGNTVKSRAQQTNPNQMTRAQYEAYLEEMKRGE